VYLPGFAGVSGVVTFLGVEYYPRGGSGYFKELALIFKVELKFKVCKYRYDNLLDFTPSNLQSIEIQFHTFSSCSFPEFESINGFGSTPNTKAGRGFSFTLNLFSLL